MKQKITFITVLLLSFLTIIILAQANSKQNDENSLRVNVEKISGFNYTTNDIPLIVVLENNSENPIRILDAFEPKSRLSAFFNIEIKDDKGATILRTRSAKIDMPKDSMKYIELKKGEKYEIPINLKDLISAEIKLKSDSYFIFITYRNQYGQNCFKGKLESNPINLIINE